MTQPEHATTIAPWLSVNDGIEAVAFYKRAFGGAEAYRLEHKGHVVVAQLTVDGAPFWVQEDPDSGTLRDSPGPIRMVITVEDPDALFQRAIDSGALEVAAIHEEHGWRSGRVRDPFGYDWEFSRHLGDQGQDG